MQLAWTERQEVLEKFMVGFEGTTPPDLLVSLLRSGLAGVAIYSRNYQDAAGLRAWRRAQRAELMAARAALDRDERARASAAPKRCLCLPRESCSSRTVKPTAS